MAKRLPNQNFTIGFVALLMLFFFYIMLQIDVLSMPTKIGLTLAWGALSTMLIFASYYMRMQQHKRAFAGKKQATDNLEAQQQRTIEIDLPMTMAFDLAFDALHMLHEQEIPAESFLVNIPGRKQLLTIHEEDREVGVIKAGLRTKTLGIADPAEFSKIEIRLQRLDANTTTIRIDSQATWVDQKLDLGKNLHYVNQLALHIRRESQHAGAEARLSGFDEADRVANNEQAGQSAQNKI
ncbi:MAG: hypothetical protein ACFE0Q_16305 [Anaerolineae bacterium]